MKEFVAIALLICFQKEDYSWRCKDKEQELNIRKSVIETYSSFPYLNCRKNFDIYGVSDSNLEEKSCGKKPVYGCKIVTKKETYYSAYTCEVE